jgi:hypothetical protein
MSRVERRNDEIRGMFVELNKDGIFELNKDEIAS